MGCDPFKLSRRAGRAVLSAWDGETDPAFTEVFSGQAGGGMWRVVELSSASRAPFVAKLVWGLAGSAGGEAVVTVSRDARVAVYATYVQVLVYNLDDDENAVSVRIGDSESFVQTHNVHVITGSLQVDDEQYTISPPRFATRVRFDCSDQSVLSDITLTFTNGQGDTIKQIVASTQPEMGVPIGGIDAVNVSIDPPQSVNWRLVFDLSL